jgi:hypothetical protein
MPRCGNSGKDPLASLRQRGSPLPEQGTRTLFFLFFLSLKLEPTLQALVVLEGSGKKKLEAVRN